VKKFIEEHDKKVQRILEMLPGITAWLIILFPIWGALVVPKAVAYFTIAFLVYWFYRSSQGAVLGLKGYLKIRQSEKTSWYKKYLEHKPKPNNPTWAYAHWRLGMVYEKLGNKEQAISEYEKAIELDPDNKEAKESLKKVK